MLATLSARGRAAGAGYESLLEQGRFYLERGANYGADAVRALEKAEQENPERAGSDPQFLSGLARAYALTARFTEAYRALGRWERLGVLGPEGEALRTKLLSESGLGRLRVTSAVALTRVTVRLDPADGGRVDVSTRKALERLGELLARGIDPGPEGVILLVPEGKYRFSGESPRLYAPREPAPVEVWAGDEAEVRLVALYPDPAAWKVVAGNRSASLSWPALPQATFELSREVGGAPEVIYRGSAPAFADAGLPVGVRVRYTLRSFGPRGDLVAVSSAEAETLPPVSRVVVAAKLGADLRVGVSWTLGDGTADRVRVVRRGRRGDEVVADLSDPAAIASGSVSDGPFLPGVEGVAVAYRVEAWVSPGQTPVAAAEATAEVPPLVERVTEVVQSIERGSVFLQWDTLPRDGAAQGYAIYRQRGDGAEGELVGKVEDPFAREFEYAVEDPVKASSWRHFVVPFVGDRYRLDPEVLAFRGRPPDETFERRAARGQRLPDVGLSWAPFPAAVGYAVGIGDGKEVLVKKPYLEISGLQSPLMGTAHQVKVFALDAEGRKTGLVTLEIRYEHYPRLAPKEADR